MAKRIILAVAGSGKTYHICHGINPNERNLILAYTHENIHNIKRELCNAFGKIPNLTVVKTFDAFVYQSIILPYEPTIKYFFKQPRFASKGITTMDPPKKVLKNEKNGYYANSKYIKKERLEHYITNHSQYYCQTLSELTCYVKTDRGSLIRMAAERLNLFYDHIYVDEFQDFRECDFKLLNELAKFVKDILLVGDYFQHSVSATNNSGKPFKNGKKEVGYDQFINELKINGYEVDLSTLNTSRRCSKEVCDFIRTKLSVNISSEGINQGSVMWVDEGAKEILENNRILKLVYNKAESYDFRAMNWTYSKGDTFDGVCVILTKNLEHIDDPDFVPKNLSTETVNRLYVAMTRSKSDLYLMKDSVFKKIKKKYCK